MTCDAVAWVVEGALPRFDPSRLAAMVWIGPDTATPSLDPTRQDRDDAARHPPGARPAFLIRRARLRRAVADATNRPAEAVVVVYDAEGRPTLREPDDLFVSSASRDGWIAVALARAPVGVDIEVVNGSAEPAWTVLHARERIQLRALPPSERWRAFLAIWTAKEAYLKATGLGLRHEPSLVAVAPGQADRFSLQDGDAPVATLAATWLVTHTGSTLLQAACVVLPERTFVA